MERKEKEGKKLEEKRGTGKSRNERERKVENGRKVKRKREGKT